MDALKRSLTVTRDGNEGDTRNRIVEVRQARAPSACESRCGNRVNEVGELAIIWSSDYGFTVDALELYGDEGRDKLRKAAGRSTYPVIRGLPNGVTQ